MLNRLKNFGSKISQASSNLYSTATQKIVDFFPKKVNKIISHNSPAANDEVYAENINQTADNHKQSVNTIISDTQENLESNKNNIVLGGFTGKKSLTYKKNKYSLDIQDGKIVNAYKVINKRKIQVKATTIRQITALLQKRSTDRSKVSYSVKRNVGKNSKETKLNTKLHGGYTYTNEAKTQFSLIINKGKIVKATYKNTTSSVSQDELDIIQQSINQNTQGLSDHISARRLKKQMQQTKTADKKQTSKKKPVKLNGTKKHNDAILEKQKRDYIEAEKVRLEQYRKEKTSHMQEDYKTLFRYQLALSKCNSQGTIINGSEKIAEVVLKTLAARKGITLHNFNTFLSTTNKFEVFKKVIREYLTIDNQFSTEAQENRNSLYNIFINASEIYSAYLHQKNTTSRKKRKTGPNIFDHQTDTYTQEDIQKEKDEWVKKYYGENKAA